MHPRPMADTWRSRRLRFCMPCPSLSLHTRSSFGRHEALHPSSDTFPRSASRERHEATRASCAAVSATLRLERTPTQVDRSGGPATRTGRSARPPAGCAAPTRAPPLSGLERVRTAPTTRPGLQTHRMPATTGCIRCTAPGTRCATPGVVHPMAVRTRCAPADDALHSPTPRWLHTRCIAPRGCVFGAVPPHRRDQPASDQGGAGSHGPLPGSATVRVSP